MTNITFWQTLTKLSAFYAISTINGIILCVFYSQLKKYQKLRRQVAPIPIATVTQPQTERQGDIRAKFRDSSVPFVKILYDIVTKQNSAFIRVHRGSARHLKTENRLKMEIFN